MTANFLANPSYGQAGFTTDQQAAFDGARDLFTQLQNNHGPSGQAQFNAAGPAATVNGSQIDANSIAAMQNPYTQAVLRGTLDNMREQKNNSAAEIGAKYAAAAPYGGSREAIQRAQLDRNFGKQVADTSASILGGGFDKAASIAAQNAQLAQQAGLANASSANQVNLSNAQMANSMAGQNASNQMQSYNSWYAHMFDALQRVLASGNQQQQFAQGNIDLPFTMLQRLVGVTPSLNNTGGTVAGTSTQPVQDNTLGTLLGGGLLAAKLFGLSDETEKTDIRKIGTASATDPETGETKEVPVHSYRMRGDPKTYPKLVGPMAADVQKVMPNAVKKVGGKKVVRNDILSQLMNLNGDK
jgi:hypothetical protein